MKEPRRLSPNSKLRIVVLGYLVRGPVGGMAWCNLHYLHGLRRLGHDVLFVEDSTDSEWCCYDPERSVVDANPAFGVRYTTEVFTHEGMSDIWAYWDAHQQRWHGPRAADAVERCHQADLLINISGVSPLREWTAGIPRRAFIDTDPVFTQIKHLQDAEARALALQHNTFFTYGERIGEKECLIPDDGLKWRPMRQPIVLEQWPFTPGRAGAPFTTIMQWNSYKVLSHEGRHFGMKSESFQPYIDLPRRTTAPLELALGGKDAPRDELSRAGWRIVNPLEVSWWPWDYRAYIQASAGEFGVAKHGYVTANTGAFSDRTAAYLASGRPVVVQDTRLQGLLPVGEGLMPYSTPEEAVAALASIQAEPERHQRAARKIAEDYFGSDVILRRVVEQAMNG